MYHNKRKIQKHAHYSRGRKGVFQNQDLVFIEDKHCAYVVHARKGFFALKKVTFLKNKHFAAVVYARWFFSQKRQLSEEKTSIALMWYMPAGTFFPQRSDFSIIC